jgi:hypothetical protein
LRRVLVIGAGFFGRVIARRLAEVGVTPVLASHTHGEVRLDVEDGASVRAVLRAGDVVVDTAGPFQSRSTALVEAAIELHCDIVDLSDSLAYARAVLAFDHRAASVGVRIFTSCSAIATVAASAIRAGASAAPETCDLFLAPASADTANPATVSAYLASVDWTRSREFPADRHRGYRVESAASVLLPRSWPSLRWVDFWVDPNAPFASTTVALASRLGLTGLLSVVAPVSARLVGRRSGSFSVAVSEGGRYSLTRLSAPRGSYLIAAEPAVLAAEALARGDEFTPGVVRSDAQVDAEALFARLRALGVDVSRT